MPNQSFSAPDSQQTPTTSLIETGSVRITDLEDGRARIEMTRTLSFEELLRLLEVLREFETQPK